MASSNPLRPQNRSQQQDQTGILKNQDLRNKPSVSSFKRGSENVDPNASTETGKVVNKLKGVSRLPVLAKSLQPVLSELSQKTNHSRWEQRPLTGKAQKKKACTKPVPFNLSQSRTHSQRNADVPQGKPPLMPSAQLTPVTKVRNINAGAKTETQSHKATTPGVCRTQANKSPRLQSSSHSEYKDSTDGHPHSHQCYNHTDLSSRLGCITLAQSKRPEDSSHLCKTSVIKVDVNSENQTSTTQSHVSYKGASSNLPSAVHNVLSCEGLSAVGAQCMMPRLSTCPPGPGTSNNVPQRVLKKNHHGFDTTTDKAGPFSPDPSALSSILQSDGTRPTEHVGATPRVSTCPTGRGTSIYSAQRVPAKKIHKEFQAELKSPIGSTFSPDPSVLRGILQNSGGTPNAQTGRGTSIYSARRVPVRKPQTEDSVVVKAATGNAVSFSPDPAALRSILLNEGVRAGAATPNRVSTCPTGRATSIYSAQRVPVKKNKPEVTQVAAVSSQGANRTPVTKWTPQRVANTKPQSLRKLCTTQKMSSLMGSPGLLESHDPSAGTLVCQEGEDVVQRLFEDKELMDDDHTDQNNIAAQQSLSSHKTIDALSKVKENSDSNHYAENEHKKTAQPFIQAAHRGSVIVFSSSQRLVSERSQDTPKINCPTSNNALPAQSNGSQINPSLNLTKQSQSKVSALRRRHTPLEEMFLDEECATYTSRLLSCPLQPRSGNPVASTLLFQDSTCFLPIGLSSPVRPVQSHLVLLKEHKSICLTTHCT